MNPEIIELTEHIEMLSAKLNSLNTKLAVTSFNSMEMDELLVEISTIKRDVDRLLTNDLLEKMGGKIL